MDYLRQMLMPRNKGLLAIVEIKSKAKVPGAVGSVISSHNGWRTEPGFLVYLCQYPFLEVSVRESTVVVFATFPECLARYDAVKRCFVETAREIQPFPKNPKLRAREVAALVQVESRLPPSASITFDLYEADSITKAEFYTQTIISRVRHMVTTRGASIFSTSGAARPKDRLPDNYWLTELIDFATKDYNRKVLKKGRK